ncbi:ribonuclease H-like domain-containing protein [Halalkalicoccus ordinarius]|uniref:ribonuclease H-like domain-containing protein n=1 Tax=Halalkalicoccus ordinarius TaxID=3116651 RepID=UPI00300F5FAF
MSSSSATARIACASPPFVERATATELEDWLAYFEPDLVLLAGESAALRAASVLRRHLGSGTGFFQPAGNAPASGPRTIDGVQFVLAPSTTALEEIAAYEESELDPDEPTHVLSGLLDLDVDTTTLSTTLVGREEYRSALDPERLAGEYVHVSTRLPADYRRDWDDLAVVGGGAESGAAGTPLVALDCRSDGQVLTRTLQPTRLGLRALDGVGVTRARRLRKAGFGDRVAVADADAATLADVRGLGRTTAERIRRSARAVAHGEVVRESDESLPYGDPVFIDIETDGLAPTITWLIGTLDGSSDGEYRSFLATDPDEPGCAIEAFMAWYTTNASDRPIVAYNGWNFDFSVLHDHIVEHCPEYEDDWTDTYRFDPYRWAVEQGNAVLPGQTNTLEDVASVLGYERAETGLTGAAVARAYQAWMADRSPATELDWERFDAYCEDDVRALATVYEALEASGRIVSTGEPTRDVRETTTQGSLSDW